MNLPLPFYLWTKEGSAKALNALAPLLPNCGVDVQVHSDVTTLPPPGVVLAMGQEPKQWLEAAKLVHKGRTITSLRKLPVNHEGRSIYITYSPRIHEVDYGMYVDMQCDARMALRLARTGDPNPVLGQYEYVEDFRHMIAAIEERFDIIGKPVEVCHDTETIGLDPWHPGNQERPPARFVSWQFSHKPGYSAVRYFKSKEDFDAAMPVLRQQIEWLFNSPKVSLRLANGKFDLTWHWVHTKVESTNFKFDTTLAGSLVDENRSNSLKVHARIYTDMGGYDDITLGKKDKGRMDLIPPDKLLGYAGGDTDAGLRVASALKAELQKSKGLSRFYVNILHPAARAFEVIERGGVLVDMEAYRALEADLLTEINDATLVAGKIMGGRLVYKHRDLSKPGGINLTKASLLLDFMFSPSGLNLKPKLFTEKTKEPSTSLEHMYLFREHKEAAPFIAALEKYQAATKTLNTYVYGFQKHIRSDGRFHPTYFLFVGDRDEGDGGAATGRLSCHDPAFQTIPKHTKWGKRLRRIFIAPPGYQVLERDYSQGELRVVACIGNVTSMLQAYKENKDLHVLTGAAIVGKTYDEVVALEKVDPDAYEAIRYPAKPANFGLLYGQQAEGFRDFAENNYGLAMTLERAIEIRTKFFELYPELLKYHADRKAEAMQTKQVRSPLSRIRRLPLMDNKSLRFKMFNKAINAPVQSTLSDLMIWALGREWAQGGFKTAPCFASIHDAAYDYVPEDKATEVVKYKRELMENLPFHEVGWEPQLKFVADCKLGPNMADLKKVKA